MVRRVSISVYIPMSICFRVCMDVFVGGQVCVLKGVWGFSVQVMYVTSSFA